MHRSILHLLLLTILLPAAAGVAADTATADFCSDSALKALRQQLPEVGAEDIQPTPVPGLCAIVVDGRIIYYFPASGHLLAGNLFSPSGENLTDAATTKLMNERLAGVPLDQALKIGSGKHTVIEVTDPDCPYCRKGDEFLSLRSDITRYVFFMPLPMHPESPQKVAYILSAKDPELALREVMAGKYDGKPLPAFKPNDRPAQHAAVAAKLGVRGTPNYWIDGTHIGGADIEAMKKLLK
jgi:thiol:disulfide interchange protein DsbC